MTKDAALDGNTKRRTRVARRVSTQQSIDAAFSVHTSRKKGQENEDKLSNQSQRIIYH